MPRRLYRLPAPIVCIALVAGVCILATLGGASLVNTATLMLINMIVVLGLYTFFGQSGVLSFAHVGFMGVGAYATALLTTPAASKESQLLSLPGFLEHAALPTIPAIIVAAAFVGLLAYLIAVPLMRLNGLAAGIATLAVLIILNVVLSQWEAVTRGVLTFIVTPTDTSLWGSFAWFCAAILLTYAYQQSPFGMRLEATREEPVGAQALGVNMRAERRRAFALSAAMAATAGGLYAHLLGTISPDAFYLDLTFLTLAMLVIGGMTTISGAVVGTVFVSVVAEGLRRLEANGSLPTGTQAVVLAALMIFALILRPRGIMGGRELSIPPKGIRGRRSLDDSPERRGELATDRGDH